MGQKVNPISYRLSINKKLWKSKWYSNKEYADILHQDIKIRDYIYKNCASVNIGNVETIRYSDKVLINIHTNKPGHIIGKKGAEIDKLKLNLKSIYNISNLTINIVEIRNMYLNARLVSQSIAKQISGRVSYKRAVKYVLNNALGNGVKGMKIIVSGRLGGNDMARTETFKDGKVPLHTLRANIDYSLTPAITQFGVIGVKVWVYKA